MTGCRCDSLVGFRSNVTSIVQAEIDLCWQADVTPMGGGPCYLFCTAVPVLPFCPCACLELRDSGKEFKASVCKDLLVYVDEPLPFQAGHLHPKKLLRLLSISLCSRSST